MDKPTMPTGSPPPFELLNIDHVVIREKDAACLVAFYRDVIGCTVARERDDLGLTHLYAGSALIDIIALDGPLRRDGVCESSQYGRNVDHICLSIKPFDFEALQLHFLSQGISISQSEVRFGATGMAASVYLTDPEGNGIELRA